MNKILMMLLMMIISNAYAQQAVPYKIAATPWLETLGSQRAVITVKENTNAVLVKILWRRRDKNPDQKRLIITDTNGQKVKNISRIYIDREKGEFVFQPHSGPGTYYVYYLPWQGKKGNGSFSGNYLKPEEIPDKAWIIKGDQSPRAKIIRIESRTAFDSFYPMEVIATADELKELQRVRQQSLLLFPEDRKYPIRMNHDIPYKWVAGKTVQSFSGSAQRNEYYAFQIGAFAAKREVKSLKISYSQSPFKLTCFNVEGNDAKGVYFKKDISIPKGDIQALWFGVDIPGNAKPGVYDFDVFISGDGIPVQKVPVKLTVENRVIVERGDAELWRHSRLRWLNSSLGIDDKYIAPFTPLVVKGTQIKAKTGAIALNDFGLPQSVKAKENELLEQAMSFVIETTNGTEKLRAGNLKFDKKTSGIVQWTVQAENDRLKLSLKGEMEFDGHLNYKISITPKTNLLVKDIRLELPVKKNQAQYFMGMGLPGMNCPASYNWKWNGPQDSFWIGNVYAGIHVELRGASYSGPLLNLYHPEAPPSWFNNNNGGFIINTNDLIVRTIVYSGVRELKSGMPLNFEFALLITPVKTLDTEGQFVNRYYHNGADPLPKEEDLKSGVKIFNIHHANTINPYINYPFTTLDTIKSVANTWHKKGLKVKLYYTTRELSNQAAELWALRSLGTEVLADGKGGGYMWLREHLEDHYNAQWFTTINGYERSDAALLTSGDSRWYNYYIEGLKWLVGHTDIDGLYLDDVSFDRDMLKRMRRVMSAVKPDCILDLHSNTGFSHGPATQYTEFFPYLNKLWFGESFNYDEMAPANWLVEVSGIPFGHMGDMLHAGGNPWRGMIYGMTVRYPWFTEGVNCDPREIWKVWDDFGLEKAKMIGYWDQSHIIKTSDPNVLATAYVRDHKLLISIASWAKQSVNVKLEIDWKKLGWTPKNKTFNARKINGFQESKTFNLFDQIPVDPKKGWLLEIN